MKNLITREPVPRVPHRSGLVREPMGPAMRLDWRKVHIAYVNHRCVLDSHPKSSHAKALQAFVKDLPTKPHFLTVDGTLVRGYQVLTVA